LGGKNKYEISKIIAQLTKFAREKLSNNYLELVKITSWDKDTKNTFLFVYQQLLLLLHPAVPFITEYIYQKITREKLLLTEIKIVSEIKNNNL
jgi:valyl-tRNA synthetase